MGEPPVVAGSLAVGSSVFTNVNGVKTEFIIVHQGKPSSLYDDSCNGTWLLMKDIYENRQWNSSDVNDYANSIIHSYLNSTFLAMFDSNIQKVIKQVKLPYRAGSGYERTVTYGVNGLSAKSFLLSFTEVNLVFGFAPIDEGACLSYFSGTTSNGADTKRVAYLNGSGAFWWLRSPYCNPSFGSKNAGNVYTNGSWSGNTTTSLDGIRPAFIIPSTALIDSKGNITGKTQSLSGTWMFNKELTNFPYYEEYNENPIWIEKDIKFSEVSHLHDPLYEGFSFGFDDTGETSEFCYGDLQTYLYTDKAWLHGVERAIVFDTPQIVTDTKFYNWFIENAKPL